MDIHALENVTHEGELANRSPNISGDTDYDVISTDPGPAYTELWSDHAVPEVDIMLALLCILLTTISTCGNAVAIRAILHLKSSRFTDKNNLGSLTLVIFLNLSVCDFLQTLLSAPFAALMLFSGRVQPNISPKTELVLCNVAGVSYFVMSRASISIVAILSLVRCFVIIRPMNHHNVVNWRNVVGALCVVWIGAILLSMVPFMAGGTYRYWRIYPMCEWDRLEFMFPWEMGSFTLGLMVLCVYVAPFLVPGGAVVVSSLATVGALLVARKHKKFVSRKRDYESVVTDQGTASISRKQLSAAITTLMIVATFVLCYGMWWFNSIVYLMWKAGVFSTADFVFTEVYGKTGYVYVATLGGLLMIYLNSALNPIIYYCRIFAKNSQDYKTSSSGPKGHPSSSSVEYTNRNSISSIAASHKRESDTEKMLDPVSERDESPTTSDSMA